MSPVYCDGGMPRKSRTLTSDPLNSLPPNQDHGTTPHPPKRSVPAGGQRRFVCGTDAYPAPSPAHLVKRGPEVPTKGSLKFTSGALPGSMCKGGGAPLARLSRVRGGGVLLPRSEVAKVLLTSWPLDEAGIIACEVFAVLWCVQVVVHS